VEEPIKVKLPLGKIRTDGSTQARVGLNDQKVADYAEDLLAGHPFPPVIVFFDGTDHWMADGYHRHAAAGKAGLEEIEAEVRQGTPRDAILFACGANTTHGLQRTNADKRRAVELLLRDAEWVKWTDNQIAMHCGVSHPFVGKVRAEICQPLETVSSGAVRVDKNGREINTSKIGKSKAKKPNEPVRQPEPAQAVLPTPMPVGNDGAAATPALKELPQPVEPAVVKASEMSDDPEEEAVPLGTTCVAWPRVQGALRRLVEQADPEEGKADTSTPRNEALCEALAASLDDLGAQEHMIAIELLIGMHRLIRKAANKAGQRRRQPARVF
jgi:hypothetical protein